MQSARTLAKLLALYAPVKPAAAGALFLFSVRTVCDVSVSWLLGETIGMLWVAEGKGGPLPSAFVESLWLMGVVMVCRTALIYFSTLAAAATAQKIENRLRAALFAKVTSLRFTYHDENRSGKTIARSLRDMEKARHFFREVVFGYLDAILIILGVLVLTFAEHWSYGVAIAAVVIPGFTLTVRLGVRVAQMNRTVSDDYDRVSTNLQENVAGARVVRAFGREPEESAKFGGSLGKFTSSWQAESSYWTALSPWISSVVPLAYPLTVAIGAWRIGHGQGSVGEVMAVLFGTRLLTYRLRPITRLVIMGQEAVASASRVFEVLEREDVIAPSVAPRRLPQASDGAKTGDLVLEDVHFSHPKRDAVLRGITLHVPAGTSLGILGPTGSGKTSLVQLLPRFYDPTSGRVLLDGVDIQDLDVHELRRAVGLVFQEPFLFSATVADNIAYGAPGASRERIVACAKLAAAHEFVVALPKGYDTVIGERGVSLSGGQRQRLTIARALAMDPRVLIFDDATASVDAVTEKELFDGIRAAARGRTTLVISQRVTSLKWCDRVAVLESGRLTAVGTHAELAAQSSLYRDVLHHQQLTGALS